MALTVAGRAEGPGVAGLRRMTTLSARDVAVWFGTVAFDTSYPTGGEAFNAEAESGISDVFAVNVLPKNGYTFEYVDSDTAASRKIKAYWVDTTVDGAAQAEVADTTNLSTVTGVTVVVYGYR